MQRPPTPDSALLDLVLAVQRTPRQDTDGTRGRVLTEAIQLFARGGYAGTSMRTIGAAAGIRAPSIYAHFAAKDEILAAALTEILQRFHAFVVEATAAGRAPGAQLEAIVRQHVRWQCGHRDVAGSWDVLWDVEAVAGNLAPAARAEIAARRARYHVLVAALVAALRPDDPAPEVRAEAILALCDRAPSWSRDLQDGAAGVERAADRGWELVAALLA